MSDIVAVKIDTSDLKKIEIILGKNQTKASTIVSRALNRAATTAKTAAIKQVTSNYWIKQSLIREKKIITETKSNRTRLYARVKFKDGPIPLNYFKFSPGQPRPKRPPKALKVAVKKTGMKDLRHAFVANINGNKIFERHGKKRLPIDRKFGPAVSQIVGWEDNRKQIEKAAFDMYTKRLDHEIKRMLEADK